MATVIHRLRHDLLDHDGEVPAGGPVTAPGPDGTWQDIDYDDQDPAHWGPFRHLERTLDLARADGQGVTALRALDAWDRVAPHSDNWWYNEIGVPRTIGDILLLTSADTGTGAAANGTATARADRYARLVAGLAATRTVPPTGQNLVWSEGIALRAGLLAGDPAAVTAAVTAMSGVLRVTDAEGIQADMSFHQHGAQLYSGGYGHSLALDLSRWVHALHGTPWAFGAAEVALFTDFVLDGQRWAVHGGGFDFTTMGREVARAAAHHVPDALRTVVRRLLAAGAPRADELAAFDAAMAGDPDAPRPAGSRHYPRSDYLAHRPAGAGWSLSVRMSSTRTAPTECMNGENLRGRHLGDGVAAVRVGDDPEDGYRAVLPVWDWARLPGITAEQVPDPAALFPRPNGQHGASARVGAWTDGRHAVALHHLAGTDGFTDGWKAWFCFDDAYVALGTAISAPGAAHPVVTTVDQRLATGPLTTGPGWVHQGRIGYVRPAGVPGTDAPAARVTKRTGRWWDLSSSGDDTRRTAEVFWTGFDHGPAPAGASYACLVLPGADAATTAARAAAPGFTVLAATPATLAVRCDRTGVTLTAHTEGPEPRFTREEA
ncbi:polysaccharide lyase family 8 super-sandwich domain-containing protein [Streptomyces sp. RFCAC02]|uniref:polysaccharide lyase family 8 super-sandwich domain-containing protein n=1 Tax=Streptomyces sp. RFCAC02 TaxID=2499143 RepID=UPI0019D0DE46|nr:polysaccharide lyase family 8 super-sandwich domain-containing protein [Streptomyces sp. RFCAC02]